MAPIKTDMQSTTESSESLYSYLPTTSNNLLTTLFLQTVNLYSSLDVRHQISQQHKMTGTMTVYR
jgi:hypothetical protein